jgi:hypothetical protein
VARAPGARHEYEGYLPKVFTRVREHADPEEIVAYLTTIELRRMGLTANPERAREAAAGLLE